MSFSRLLFCTAILLLAVGCSRPVSVDELRKDAERHRTTGEYAAAIIQLSNAISQAPNDAALRREIATVSLQAGDLLRAERELRQALELGASKAQVLPLLATVLVERERFQDALDEILIALEFDPVVRGHIWLARASLPGARKV